jgi:SpoVK/Ycf46/Vps4 family AAA+-type ATPase
VISNYIGETEKNLDRAFARAAASNAILFFDEADALFGKRTSVRDAHERYANSEVNYLLQRLENFRGLTILTVNRRANLDTTFTRRLRHVVEFGLPQHDSTRRPDARV